MAGVVAAAIRQIFITLAAPEVEEAPQTLDTRAPLVRAIMAGMALRITGRTTTEAAVVEQAQWAEMPLFMAEAELAAQGKPHH
jgi:hypothetical protein